MQSIASSHLRHTITTVCYKYSCTILMSRKYGWFSRSTAVMDREIDSEPKKEKQKKITVLV